MTSSRMFAAYGRIAPLGIFAALILMAVVQWRMPFLNELGSHTIDAWRIWRGEMACAGVYRLPLGYPGWIAPFIAAFGDAAGVKFANIMALAILLCGGLAFFAGASRAERINAGERLVAGLTQAQLGSLMMLAALTLYPYTILNAARANEALLAAALLVTFCALLLQKPDWTKVVAAAVCLGLAMHARANMVSLLLPAALWLALRADEGWGRRAGYAAAALATLSATYSLVSLLLAGCLWFSPTNGGYNFYAGNNPLSARYLAAEQNAEYSIVPALRDAGFAVAEVADGYAVPQEAYVALAKRFILDCPTCAAKLAAQKTAVFFAPRLQNAGGGAEAAAQYALAALTLAAFALALIRFIRRRCYAEGVILAAVAAYALPFALTNADPRLRFPLDVLMLCYLVVRCEDWLVSILAGRRAGVA